MLDRRALEKVVDVEMAAEALADAKTAAVDTGHIVDGNGSLQRCGIAEEGWLGSKSRCRGSCTDYCTFAHLAGIVAAGGFDYTDASYPYLAVLYLAAYSAAPPADDRSSYRLGFFPNRARWSSLELRVRLSQRGPLDCYIQYIGN